jgi:FkbM family methyltransferase
MIINLSLHGLGYGNMYVDSWTGEEWFVKKVLSPTNPKICFDVGANIGKYTQMLLYYTQADIYAIEPSTSSFKKLENLVGRVIKLKTAIADFNGEAILYSKIGVDEKASLDKNVRRGNEENVTVLTIQTIAKKYGIHDIDFLKIDTEGYEKEILKGLGDLRPAFIQFEFNICHLYRKQTLYEIIQPLSNYEFYRLLPHGWLKIDPRKFLNNIFVFCNIIAVRK